MQKMTILRTFASVKKIPPYFSRGNPNVLALAPIFRFADQPPGPGQQLRPARLHRHQRQRPGPDAPGQRRQQARHPLRRGGGGRRRQRLLRGGRRLQRLHRRGQDARRGRKRRRRGQVGFFSPFFLYNCVPIQT